MRELLPQEFSSVVGMVSIAMGRLGYHWILYGKDGGMSREDGLRKGAETEKMQGEGRCGSVKFFL